MTARGYRAARLADQIRIEIAEMIAGELNDPRIGVATVTRVEMSPDLRHARVLVSAVGNEEAQAGTLEGLTSATGFVRREISHRLNLRRAPEIGFVLDHGVENGLRIEGLLQKLSQGE
jgi:ribosome-binding factor A